MTVRVLVAVLAVLLAVQGLLAGNPAEAGLGASTLSLVMFAVPVGREKPGPPSEDLREARSRGRA